MDHDALVTMDSTMQSSRLKKWNNPASSNSNYYCYVYNSNNVKNGQIQDPILHGQTCSMDDYYKLGQPEFVKNIFTDASFDPTTEGKAVYNKCVFEINPSKINAQNINRFWSALSSNECASYKGQGVRQTSNLVKIVASCNQSLSHYNNQYALGIEATSNIKKYHTSVQGLIKSIASNDSLYSNVKKAQYDIDCYFFGKSNCQPKSQQDALKQQLSAQNQVLDSEQNKKQGLLKELQQLHSNLTMQQERSNQLARQYTNLVEARDFCIQSDTLFIDSNIGKARQQLETINSNLKSLTTKHSKNKEVIDTQQINKNNFQVANVSLKSNIEIISNDITDCGLVTRKLESDTSNNRLEIIKYKQLIQDCAVATRQKQDLLNDLKRQYNELLQELNKKRLELDALRLKHMDQLQKDIEAATKSAKSNVTQSCGDSSQLATEVKALIAEKEAKLSQAPKTISRCSAAKPV
jgi:hypothetical protein